jgi:hypothetical protein
MKPLPAELEAKIDETKSWLFDGDQDKVAARCRKSRVFVNRVFNKRAFSTQVLAAGIEVMNENKVKFEIQPSMKIA